GHLLAAADDRIRIGKLQIQARRAIEAPERLLKAAMAAEGMPCRHDGLRVGLVPEIHRRGAADDRAFRQPGTRAAEACAVAEAVDAIDAGPPIAVEDRGELAAPRVENMAAAQSPQHLVGGLEAIAEADRIDPEASRLRISRRIEPDMGDETSL